MLYDKKIVSIICLSLCFSLYADNCSVSNVQKKADKLKSDAATLQKKATQLQANAVILKTNATTLQANATALKTNATILKTNATQLEQDYNKLMVLLNNSDLLDDAVANLNNLKK